MAVDDMDLDELDLFKNLDRKERAVVRTLGTTIRIDAGRVVAEEGMIGRQFAVVLDGLLEVTRSGEHVALLSAGECVGEISLMLGHGATATATVTTAVPSTVWVLDRNEFAQLCELVPGAFQRISDVALHRAFANASH